MLYYKADLMGNWLIFICSQSSPQKVLLKLRQLIYCKAPQMKAPQMKTLYSRSVSSSKYKMKATTLKEQPRFIWLKEALVVLWNQSYCKVPPPLLPHNHFYYDIFDG